jgi:hypothetical protein
MESSDEPLSVLKSHSPTSFSNYKGPQVSFISNLPYEILYEIIEFAICPDFVIALTIEPIQIEMARELCDDPLRNGGEPRAQRESQKNGKIARLVSRAWKAIADKVITYQWVLNVGGSESPLFSLYCAAWGLEKQTWKPDYPPIRTQRCSRLNMIFGGDQDPTISVQYSHPISTLTILTYKSSLLNLGESGSVSSLKSIVSFPEHLRSLWLHVYSLNVSDDLIQEFRSRMVSLTTLSLCLKNASILHAPLEIPSLKSLFLSIPIQEVQGSPKSHIQMPWVLPALRNLSLTAKGGFGNRLLHYESSMFLSLIQNYFNQITSLRLSPMITQIGDQSSPLCWTNMPRLQVLATHFWWPSKQNEDIFASYTYLKDWTPLTVSNSVRHLVQISDPPSRRPDVPDFSGYIYSCKNLKTISLAWEARECKRFLYGSEFTGCTRGSDNLEASELQSLKDYCDYRNAYLLDKNCIVIREEDHETNYLDLA